MSETKEHQFWRVLIGKRAEMGQANPKTMQTLQTWLSMCAF